MTTIDWPRQKPWFTVILGCGTDTCFTVHVRATSQYTAVIEARRNVMIWHDLPDHEVDALETYAVFLGIQENLVQSDTPNPEEGGG
jgi:hypothetical protein